MRRLSKALRFGVVLSVSLAFSSVAMAQVVLVNRGDFPMRTDPPTVTIPEQGFATGQTFHFNTIWDNFFTTDRRVRISYTLIEDDPEIFLISGDDYFGFRSEFFILPARARGFTVCHSPTLTSGSFVMHRAFAPLPTCRRLPTGACTRPSHPPDSGHADAATPVRGVPCACRPR